MTDRIHALTVVLNKDIRTDDIQPLIDAIFMLRHVADVTTHVADAGDYLARARVADALHMKLHNTIKEFFDVEKKI